MYITRNEYLVTPTRGAEFEAWYTRFVEAVKPQIGSQGGLLLNSLGYPTRYIYLGRWQSREAQLAWIRGAERAAFVEANPNEGLFIASHPVQAYEMVHQVTTGGQRALYASLVDWHIDRRPGNAEDFESSRKEIFELRQKHQKGFAANWLLRFLGDPVRYMVALLYTTVEAVGADQAAPIQEFGRAHPYTEYVSTPFILDRYQVVLQM